LARILLDCSAEWRQKIIELVNIDLIEDERVRRLLEDAKALQGEGVEQGEFFDELLRRSTDPEASSLVAELSHARMPGITDETIRLQLRALLQRQAREGARRLTPQIVAAEERGDTEELERLLAEKTRLRQNSAEF
jgi:hypothetical protein